MNETAEIPIDDQLVLEETRQRKYLLHSCLLGLIWFTHATVPAIMWRFGISRHTIHIMSVIAWKSFVYTRLLIYGTLFSLWSLAFIVIKDDIFAQYYYKGWVYLQMTSFVATAWVILAFFLASCIGGDFVNDYVLMFGIITYNSVFLYCVYLLWPGNMKYYGWTTDRDELIRFFFPDWQLLDL